MAFNAAVFKTRALTAIVFVAVMLTGLLLNAWSFFILFSIIHFGCWIEYQKLVSRIDPEYALISPFHKYGVMIAGWCIMLYFTRDEINLFGLQLHAMGWWMGLLFVFILPVIELLFAKQMRLKNIAHSALGLLYISLSFGLLMDLYGYSSIQPPASAIDAQTNEFSIASMHIPWLLPVVIIGCMWVNDTMAYIVGSFIGKTPFSKISPKKTWEGTIGGAVLCIVVVGLLLSYLWKNQTAYVYINPVHWYIIAAIAAITGTAGDLFESKLKRLAGVKDSGHLMPGHGGFLDRFDSLLVATPFIWLYVTLFIANH